MLPLYDCAFDGHRWLHVLSPGEASPHMILNTSALESFTNGVIWTMYLPHSSTGRTPPRVGRISDCEGELRHRPGA